MDDSLDTYEPGQEDIVFLNMVDQGYIGLTKPKVQRITEIYYWEEPDIDWRFDVDQE